MEINFDIITIIVYSIMMIQSVLMWFWWKNYTSIHDSKLAIKMVGIDLVFLFFIGLLGALLDANNILSLYAFSRVIQLLGGLTFTVLMGNFVYTEASRR